MQKLLVDGEHSFKCDMSEKDLHVVVKQIFEATEDLQAKDPAFALALSMVDSNDKAMDIEICQSTTNNEDNVGDGTGFVDDDSATSSQNISSILVETSLADQSAVAECDHQDATSKRAAWESLCPPNEDPSSSLANAQRHSTSLCVQGASIPLLDSSKDEAYGLSLLAAEKHKRARPLCIDRTLIKSLGSQSQPSALLELGVAAYEQEALEAGVLQQVDQALSASTPARSFETERSYQAVVEDLKSCHKALQNIEEVQQKLLPHVATSKEAARRFESVRRQKENKERQLKSLEARQRHFEGILGHEISTALQAKVQETECKEVGPSSLGSSLTPEGESEWEMLIRTGQMTPFGSRDEASTSDKSTTSQPQPRRLMLSDNCGFESYLEDQAKLAQARKMRLPLARRKRKATLGKVVRVNDHSQGVEARPVPPKPRKVNNKKVFVPGTKQVDQKLQKELEKLQKHALHLKKISSMRKPRSKGDLPEAGDTSDSGDVRSTEGGEEHNAWDPQDFDSDAVSLPWKHGRLHRTAHQKEDEVLESSSDDGISGEDEEEEVGKGGRALSQHLDDGNANRYRLRIRKWRRQRIREKWKRIQEGDGDVSDESDIEVDGGFKIPSFLWQKLYKYQQTGVRWFWELHCQQAGGILGDEMGLGKTIQVIAFFAGLSYSGLRTRGLNYRYEGLGPSLIVCPTTMMQQWVHEFHAWWPPFRVAVLHDSGSYTGRKSELIKSVVAGSGVLITSYACVRLLHDILLKQVWHYVILDEGHKIRNPEAAITVACKQFKTPHRIILSGSPIQNNLKELWSLVDFVYPGKLGTLSAFMEQFSVPITMGGYSNASPVQVKTAYRCACILRDTISPYLLRRMKADVKNKLALPDKNEQVLFCRLTDEQRSVYQTFLNSREVFRIMDGNFQVFSALVALRKICNHPDLYTGGPHASYDGAVDGRSEGDSFGDWRRSGKMLVIEALLHLWQRQGHRVLLFSQSRQMLEILKDFVQRQGYTYVKMDGTTSIASRQPLINKFNKDESIFLFLLTTRVGGLGVNLTGADRVIIFDPDWNPSIDTQARERAWRIGQTRQVTIYRLLTAGTIEEKIYHRQIFKQYLTNRVLKDPKQRRFFKTNNLCELFTLSSPDGTQDTETSALFAGTGSEVKIAVKGKSHARDKRQNNVLQNSTVVHHSPSPSLHHLPRGPCRTPGEQSRGPGGYVLSEPVLSSLEHVTDADVATCDSNKWTNAVGLENTKQKVLQSFGEDGQKSQSADKMQDVRGEGSLSNGTGILQSTPMDTIHRKRKEKRKHVTFRDHKDVVNQTKGDGVRRGKKHKKGKDARVDGVPIPHLVREAAFCHGEKGNGEREARRSWRSSDDYILEKLFKKSGVHSALKHDAVMDGSDPDYLLVEAEATRVAHDALRVLKQSRRAYQSRQNAVGSHAKPKFRFGQKKNPLMVLSNIHRTSSRPQTNKCKDADILESVEPGSSLNLACHDGVPTPMAMSDKPQSMADESSSGCASADLLARMRHRNRLVQRQALEEGEEDGQMPSGTAPPTEYDGLLAELLAFLTSRAGVNVGGRAMGGRVTTEEVLDEFGTRLEPEKSPVFRTLLHSLCTFKRTADRTGLWTLRPEYS
uniref:DNA excision repair protein ERCC-6 n=1 Tax=Myxine glutinosa TaxID=7769 RepID=UPI00358DFE96